jgi:hypothetical protein
MNPWVLREGNKVKETSSISFDQRFSQVEQLELSGLLSGRRFFTDSDPHPAGSQLHRDGAGTACLEAPMNP